MRRAPGRRSYPPGEAIDSAHALSNVAFNEGYRYVDWLLTVPLLLIETVAVMALAKSDARRLLYKLVPASALMIVLGYPGEITSEVGPRLLGPRTPMAALATAARRTRAAAVLVWLSRPDEAAADGLRDVAAAHRRVRVLVGGPGWAGVDTGPATAPADLAGAIEELGAAWRRTSPRSA